MNLFIYGTLLVPRIWNAVTAHPSPESIPATLSGYQIFRVLRGDFPAIVSDQTATIAVPGRLILNVPPTVLHRLDQYEGDFYERVIVEVDAEDAPIIAQTYRIPAKIASEILSAETWTLEWFEREALNRYWNRIFCG